MEDKKPISGLPEKAGSHFDNRLEELKKIPKERRENVWWATLMQMGDELEEMVRQGKMSEEEADKVKEGVGRFMNIGKNIEGLEEAKQYFRKLGVDKDLAPWWKTPEADTP